MNIEEQFNKEEFANLLERAKGERSINQFANETGVSAAHISRFLRQMIASPPTPETISKFAAKAHNEVTYQDLMVAAGHLARRNDEESTTKSTVEKDSPLNLRNKAEVQEKKFVQVILADLYERPFKWTVEKPEPRPNSPDMIINIDHDEYNRWCLEFMPMISSRPRFSPMNYLMLYGRISMYEILDTDKFTIVVNDEEVFNRIKRKPPLSLRANLYVMLIDLEWGKIVKEELLCRYEKY